MSFRNIFLNKSPLQETIANPDAGIKKEDYQVKGTSQYKKLHNEFGGDVSKYLDNRYPKRSNKGENKL